MSLLNTFIRDVRVCESDICRLTCGGVSNEVIYLCAVRALSRMVYGQLHLQSMGQCVKVSALRVIYVQPGV